MTETDNPFFPPKWSEGPSFAQVEAKVFTRPAFAAGKRYERQVIAYLAAQCERNSLEFKVSPWIYYKNSNNEYRYCQPDFVIFHPDYVLVVEIKLRHTQKALPQLEQYSKLIQKMYIKHKIKTLEVCKYYDAYEGVTTLVDSLFDETTEPATLILKP